MFGTVAHGHHADDTTMSTNRTATRESIPQLEACLATHATGVTGLDAIAARLRHYREAQPDSLQNLIELYDDCYPLIEKAMWDEADDARFDTLLDCYQGLFREQEALIREETAQARSADARHDFILAIPVADRPHHLHACLESIYQVLACFGYGGQEDGVYTKIRILIAEDSRHEENVRRHVELVEDYKSKGLQIHHLDQAEQYALLQSLPADARERLGKLLTRQPKERFYLKGQAANRNLSYLKFRQLTAERDRTLYYLVDSDQNFCVNRQGEMGEQTVYALNYFYIIDRLFRTTDTQVLTGKMVGDPPVSPAVMAANFLDDVTAFFSRLATLDAAAPCHFHVRPDKPVADAAYHDMAGLFGFNTVRASFPYCCPIAGAHDHAACLRLFSRRLHAFFFGEHLTRKTDFVYGEGFATIKPARTIYPGNYVVNHAGLRYVIPFGHLRLRMSGPTAGRLIAAEIGQRFAAVNMPHLHRRTTAAGVGDDFRPGVELDGPTGPGRIDLSNEFERQFFGDLMLFTTEALVKAQDINKPFAREGVLPILEEKEAELLALYAQKQDAIAQKLRTLSEWVFAAQQWWTQSGAFEAELAQVRTFLDNIAHNFGPASPAWQAILSDAHRAERQAQIIDALVNYRAERDTWDRLFD